MTHHSLFQAFLLTATFCTACGDSSGGAGGGSTGQSSTGQGGSSAAAPKVTSTIPLSGAMAVPIDGEASATFDKPMDCASLTTKTFQLTAGASAVAGTVLCSKSTVVFWPASHLAQNTSFTAKITTGAKSAAGVALGSDYSWTFQTGSVVAGAKPVNLEKAGSFAVLAKAAVSTVPTSAITGNVGVSPAAADAITGFSLTADPTNVFSTSPQVTGKVFAADYAAPTPSDLTTAVSDMQLAFTDAAARAPDATELGAGNIGGMSLAPGVYKWGTGLSIPTDVTLAGDANSVWIFQIAQDLVVASGAHVKLSGGALSKNVFWQVAGLVDVGTTAHLEGVVLTQTAVTLHTTASVNGRLFAQTAVNLDSNVVTEPSN